MGSEQAGFPYRKNSVKESISSRMTVCLPGNGNEDMKAAELHSVQGAFMEKKMGHVER